MNSRVVVKKIAELLEQSVGLDVSAFGDHGLEGAVQRRMEILGLRSRSQYWESLRRRNDELQGLVEELVVSETWFFREIECLQALVEQAEQWSSRSHPGRPLRILSVPCATGEEPLSIAMALIDAGWSPDRFRIVASDISLRNLGRAAAGVFDEYSFRGADLAYRSRHFRASGGAFQASAQLMSTLRFEHGNLVAPDFLSGEPAFDFVFCRNLFIYLSREARHDALQSVLRQVRDGGGVFVAAAECRLLNRPPFQIERTGTTFMFRPLAERSSAPSLRRGDTTLSLRPTAGFMAFDNSTAKPAVRPDDPPTLDRGGLRTGMATELLEAKRLADAGRLREAETLCEAFLDRGAPCSQALYLLGLVRDAQGDGPGAEAFYRKALYLDPRHYEALVQLSLVRKRAGDEMEAKLLQERAGRLQIRQEVQP